jgi:tRNA modification GTPase
MPNLNQQDTIAAIATSFGEAGIGIVRLSGARALEIAEKIFLAKDNRRPGEFKTYTLHYGWIVDRQPPTANRQPEVIDEVLLTVMRAPHSYTKEDVVEINCHGGPIALRRALELVLENGCRLAEPGEFTKRAFLNGRLDLAQAEAVLDIIRAKSEAALKAGLGQLKGVFSQRLSRISKMLLGALADLEGEINFPEEGLGSISLRRVRQQLEKIDRELASLLKDAKLGRALRDGLQVVICGRPNVGKSSLLNALLRQERCLVSHIPGTTRDTIEELIDIKGLPVKLVDTAGLTQPRGLIEEKALERSRKFIQAADLVLLVFDGSRRLQPEDKRLVTELKRKPVLAVVNKIDLARRIEKKYLRGCFPHLVEVSASQAKNIGLLEEAIFALFSGGRAALGQSVVITNLRHIQAVDKAKKLVAQALISLDNKLSAELISQDLQVALDYLEETLGRRFSQKLLERIFSEFCVGK